MIALIELFPKEYGFVVIVLILYCFLNFYMAIQVGKAHKKYLIPLFMPLNPERKMPSPSTASLNPQLIPIQLVAQYYTVRSELNS